MLKFIGYTLSLIGLTAYLLFSAALLSSLQTVQPNVMAILGGAQ